MDTYVYSKRVRYILYRIYDDHGKLLYVGATTNPALRYSAHHHSQPWWDDAAEIKLEHLDSAEELTSAELFAIETEAPEYNLLGVRSPAVWAMKPNKRKKGEGSIFQRSDGIWVGSLEATPFM